VQITSPLCSISTVNSHAVILLFVSDRSLLLRRSHARRCESVQSAGWSHRLATGRLTLASRQASLTHFHLLLCACVVLVCTVGSPASHTQDQSDPGGEATLVYTPNRSACTDDMSILTSRSVACCSRSDRHVAEFPLRSIKYESRVDSSWARIPIDDGQTIEWTRLNVTAIGSCIN
jgi:hypothetical protein